MVIRLIFYIMLSKRANLTKQQPQAAVLHEPETCPACIAGKLTPETVKATGVKFACYAGSR